MDDSTAASPRLGRWLDEAERLDVAVYAAIAAPPRRRSTAP